MSGKVDNATFSTEMRLFRLKFAQKIDLGLEFQKGNVGIGINILK